MLERSDFSCFDYSFFAAFVLLRRFQSESKLKSKPVLHNGLIVCYKVKSDNTFIT